MENCPSLTTLTTNAYGMIVHGLRFYVSDEFAFAVALLSLPRAQQTGIDQGFSGPVSVLGGAITIDSNPSLTSFTSWNSGGGFTATSNVDVVIQVGLFRASQCQLRNLSLAAQNNPVLNSLDQLSGTVKSLLIKASIVRGFVR